MPPASSCLPACLQGFLYALDCYGVTLPGFPLQMGDIQVGPVLLLSCGDCVAVGL